MSNKEAITWILRQAVAFRANMRNVLSANHGYIQDVVAFRKLRKPKSKKDIDWLAHYRPQGGWCHGSSWAADLDNFVGTLMDASQAVLYPNDCMVVKSTEQRVWYDDWGADYTLTKVELHEWKEQE